jgi:hypothetical protein
MQKILRKKVLTKKEKEKLLPVRRYKIIAKRLTIFLVRPISSLIILRFY